MIIPQSLLDRIEERLLSGDITNFYIGITEDWEKREQGHLDEYTLGNPIAFGDLDIIREAEKELIKWAHLDLAKKAPNVKCDNRRDAGGEGAKIPEMLYIVAKEKPSLFYDCLPDVLKHQPKEMRPLFNFEPVKLKQPHSTTYD